MENWLSTTLGAAAKHNAGFRRLLLAALDMRDTWYTISAQDDTSIAGLGHEFWWDAGTVQNITGHHPDHVVESKAVAFAAELHTRIGRPVVVLQLRNMRGMITARIVWASWEKPGWGTRNGICGSI